MRKSKILHSSYLEHDEGLTDEDEEVEEITSRIGQKEKVIDKQFQLTEDIYQMISQKWTYWRFNSYPRPSPYFPWRNFPTCELQQPKTKRA